MLRTILIIAACLLFTLVVSAQQKIGDNTLILDPASLLELESTSQGFLPSRLTTAQRNAQTEWDEGHIIYNTTDNCLQIYNGSSWDCFLQGVSVDSTIYRYNGSLSADRTVTMNSRSLTFDGSGGDIVITSAGRLGIGISNPQAQLDVDGGTVRLSDYGTGMINGSESYLLGVDSEGDVIEVSPAIDTFSLVGDELRISLKGDTVSYDSVTLTKYLDNTDDQILDSLGLDGTTLNIGIEGDMNGLQSLDLTPILGSSENIYNTSDTLTEDRVVTLDGNSLTFNAATDADIIIQADGDIGIGTTTPSGDLDAVSDEDQEAFRFVQETGTSGQKDVFTIEDQDAGDGTQDESSVLKVIKSGDISASDNGFSLVELANTGADPGASKYWISGRKTDEGAPLWGVDITDNDFWSEGGIVLGVTGADGGTYSGGNFIVEQDGDVGIGTTTPGARLEVDGGSVIFDEYGVGTYSDTSANYILATDTAGNVVELNTALNTRWFYPPAIVIDASAISTDDTLDLHANYVDQFSVPLVKNPEAPALIPTYDKDELYYFITYYDDTVLENITIDDDGVMVYDIKAVPFDNYTVINVVFLIKD